MRTHIGCQFRVEILDDLVLALFGPRHGDQHPAIQFVAISVVWQRVELLDRE